MSLPIVSKFLFTISYPSLKKRNRHVPLVKLQALSRRELTDLDVIETIDHLFKCTRCFENYRRIHAASLNPSPPVELRSETKGNSKNGHQRRKTA